MARIEEFEALVKHQALKIEEQAAKILELEKRLSKNSRNNSKPPSSNGLGKPPRTTSLREKGKNKSGGQKGHQGKTLKQSAHPDKIIRHVFDIPPLRVEVTEHQSESKYCSCCNKVVSSLFPQMVTAPCQYGSVIRSWAVYYQNQHFIPEDRLQQLFIDMYGVSLATATLANYNATALEELSDFEETMLSMAKKATVKHLDETGFRVAGKTQWLHTLSTEILTYYHVSPKRKSLLNGLSGIVVHDHWRPYYQLEGVEHALCNQHHLREFLGSVQAIFSLPLSIPMPQYKNDQSVIFTKKQRNISFL